MKKYRLMSLILALCLSVSLLAACGGGSAPSSSPAADPVASEPASEADEPAPSEPAGDPAEAEYTFTMAHTHSPESFGGQMMQKMADLLEEHSGGRIAVEVYPGGQLGDKIANLEGLRSGTVDITQCAATDISSFKGRWSVFSLPFMFADVEEASKAFLDEDFLAVLNGDTKEIGLKLLAMENAGSRSVINAKHAINEPADCVGLKVRSLQDKYIARGFELCGFAVVALGWTEVYPALQQGTIDGADNSPPYIYDAQFQEVCKYFSITEMIRQPGTIFMRDDLYEELPDDLKAVVDAASAEWIDWQWAYYEEYDADALVKLEEAGVEINTITPENRQKFQDATAPVYDELFEEFPDAKELYDLMMAALDK